MSVKMAILTWITGIMCATCTYLTVEVSPMLALSFLTVLIPAAMFGYELKKY